MDQCKIMELMTDLAPEAFVHEDSIQASRLVNYIMFVLNSVFKGNIHDYIRRFTAKLMTLSENLQQFLYPLVGILSNLYKASISLEGKQYQTMEKLIKEVDVFEVEFLWELKKQVE